MFIDSKSATLWQLTSKGLEERTERSTCGRVNGSVDVCRQQVDLTFDFGPDLIEIVRRRFPISRRSESVGRPTAGAWPRRALRRYSSRIDSASLESDRRRVLLYSSAGNVYNMYCVLLISCRSSHASDHLTVLVDAEATSRRIPLRLLELIDERNQLVMRCICRKEDSAWRFVEHPPIAAVVTVSSNREPRISPRTHGQTLWNNSAIWHTATYDAGSDSNTNPSAPSGARPANTASLPKTYTTWPSFVTVILLILCPLR
jgi:hypothetical protein